MKNLLHFSILLFASAGAFAQLTVKPTSAGADSYVYVNDQVLYVAQDINLTKNPTAATEASIYLRNNGQLIQSGTTSTNNGLGFLSVQQNTPVTNAYSYYYWCSPVGNPAALAPMTVGNNKNFGVASLYESLSGTTGTNAIQSAFTSGVNGSTGPLTISTRWLYTFMTPGIEAEANYTRMRESNKAPAGFGFTMKGVDLVTPGPDQLYEFRGRPNNGSFPIPVAAPVSGVAQMTLTGNPYPSALDLNMLWYDADNINKLSAIYYYDEDRSIPSHNYATKAFGYGVWVPMGQDATPNNPLDFPGAYTAATFRYYTSGGGQSGSVGNGSSNNHKRYAPIGQGFMFVGSATVPVPPNNTVTIKSEHRVFIRETAGTNSVFFRPGNNINDETTNDPDPDPNTGANDSTTARPDYRDPQMRIWTVFDEQDGLTRDMLLVFNNQATDGYDNGFDGLSPLGMKNDVYFPIGNDNELLPFVINGTNYSLDKQIPITFKLKDQKKIIVMAVEEVKKPYENAYVFDSQQNTYQQITSGQSATFNLPAGKYENRFFVVFRNPNVKRDAPLTELEKKNIVMENVTFFQNNPAQQLEVSNPEGYTLKSAAVYDMNGKLVINEKNLGDNNKYSFYTGNLSDGVYLVKLTTSEDITIDYKTIVHNK